MNFWKKKKSPKKLQWSLVAYTPPLPSLACDTPHVQNRRTPAPPNVIQEKDFTRGGLFARDFSRETFRERLCRFYEKDILRDRDFARDFAREHSDPSRTYVLWSFDLVAIF